MKSKVGIFGLSKYQLSAGVLCERLEEGVSLLEVLGADVAGLQLLAGGGGHPAAQPVTGALYVVPAWGTVRLEASTFTAIQWFYWLF